MRKFQYSMENILKIKFKLEDQAKSNYSLIRNRLNKEEKILEELYYKKGHYENKLIEKIVGSLNFKDINFYRKALNVVDDKIKSQEALIKEIEVELERARKKLEGAMIERKTQENLKEKAFDEYKIEYNAWENKEIDELNSFNYSSSI